MFDVVIVGAGPAGMTAAIYLKRANKNVLVLEKEGIGGQIASSSLVENYPGYKAISGAELANNMYEQVTNLGVDVELEEVLSINKDKTFTIVTDSNTYEAKSVIIATGAKYRLLGLKNETNLIGNGIHFCVACDGAFYKDKEVAVIGGGNSAAINALTLSEICKKVYVIQNLETLTCEDKMKQELSQKDNVEIICSALVSKLNGEDELESIEIISNNKNETIKIDGMFIAIGHVPESSLVKDMVKLDNYNYIETNECETSVEGLFVAGDCRVKKVRQLTTAVNDGTLAATLAINYLNK